MGQRVALNLTGHEKPSIERGDVICHEQITMTTQRFDASIEVRTAAKGLKNHQRVRLHLGTAERIGTVILLGTDETLGPRQSAFCQLVLTDPLGAMRGDHFVIRDETAQRTLGGGVVIHPLAHRHKRNEAGLLDRLGRLQNGSLADALTDLLADDHEFASTVGPLHQILNVPVNDVRAQLAQMPSVTTFDLDGELLYTSSEKWRSITEQLVRLLRA